MKLEAGMQEARGRISKTAALTWAALCVFAFAASSALAAPPLISGTTVSAVGETSATLEAKINPQGKEALYHFEYGPGDCSKSACTKTAEAKIPAGSSPAPVKAAIGGLTPATIYHFRLVARNGETTNGPDRIFATFSAALQGLPDSRAYEQASPVDKNGGDVVGEVALVKAALGGGGITFGSTFGIPGGKGSQTLPSYLASRGAGQSGWSTQGLLPPAITGEQVQMLGWSPDLTVSYSSASKLGSPSTQALVAQPADGGAITLLTPYVPHANYSYAGASQDGSVVLFESTAKLPVKEGPEGIEGAPNLYAWDGESEELHLAGVLNGVAPPKGAFAGPYTWARGINGRTLREGGGAQRHYLQDEHAITPDGSVYFTEAGSAKLYLRRNPAQPQSAVTGGQCTDPAKACTIEVSASEKTNGQGPDGTDPAGTQPAAFAAASEDGSKVFFTSPEKLVNDANTGPEQPAAAIGRATGAIEDAAFVPTHAVGVTADSEYVYWADPAVGTIGRAKLDGSEPPDDAFVAPGETKCEVALEKGGFEEVTAPSRPRYVAVDSEHVYWTNSGPLEEQANQPIEGCGTIGRAKLDGSEPEADFIHGQLETAPGKFEARVSSPQGIAVNASHIYWANAPVDVVKRSIARAETGGGGVEGSFFEVKTTRVPVGVTLSATHIYFGANEDQNDAGYVIQVPLTGGEEKLLYIGKAGIRGVALDAGHVYWATQGERAIGRVNLELEAASQENKFIEPEGILNGLAADAAHLYWSVNGEAPTNPGNDLYRFEAGAQAGERLTDLSVDSTATNGAEVLGVLGTSADGSHLYFAANGDLDGAGPATPGDCETTEPHGSLSSLSGECNIYLWREGAPTALVARIDASGKAGGDALNWAPTTSELFGEGGAVPKTSTVSKDGETLLFRSQQKLSAYDNEGVPELYRFEVGATPPVSCLSCPPSEEAAGRGPSLGSVAFPGLHPRQFAAFASRNLSGDGKRAFFETTEALSPLDTNAQGGCPPSGIAFFPACLDVYEWEAPESGSCKAGSPSYSSLNDGCIYLLSTGKSKYPSFFADASASGEDVFFFTREQLVGQDEDELQDVYDARVDGGLASQFPVKAPPCEGADACHGPAQFPPLESSPGSATFVGPANPAPKHQKAKKQQKHKKQKHRKQKKGNKHKRANAKQGASR
jgi:hypothetical protein